MKKTEALDILSRINQEGFDYCFDGYSNWEEVKDRNFHYLREEYVLAKKALKDYLEKCRQ